MTTMTPQPHPCPWIGSDQAAADVRAAAGLVSARYPEATGAVLGGSAACGQSTPGSDLDITVLLPDHGMRRREVLRHDGRLAEVFLNSRSDLRTAFVESRTTRRATALFLFADSIVLHDADGQVEALRQEAKALLTAGPDPLTGPERDAQRALLTDLLDDLTDTGPHSDPHEQLAVADRVLREAAQLLTAHHRTWNGAGKWLPRRLKDADPDLGQHLLDGHLVLARDADPTPLTASAMRVLNLTGGPLREGYVDR
ncbi:nucleotidyltransferase domain-containing protein [Streptomyces globisporus]|uniref:nucleotidyltransferase domain-containing protein n=1 Tax=Streptomyces TaxID=1883 RepID=UPI00211D37BA|nr:nucleotidyltransferase domain-containing protein [Streptomyces sp. st170]WSV94052.1 nucleotidyltransferase domain-containing protein [Streptomyces globisporus]